MNVWQFNDTNSRQVTVWSCAYDGAVPRYKHEKHAMTSTRVLFMGVSHAWWQSEKIKQSSAENNNKKEHPIGWLCACSFCNNHRWHGHCPILQWQLLLSRLPLIMSWNSSSPWPRKRLHWASGMTSFSTVTKKFPSRMLRERKGVVRSAWKFQMWLQEKLSSYGKFSCYKIILIKFVSKTWQGEKYRPKLGGMRKVLFFTCERLFSSASPNSIPKQSLSFSAFRKRLTVIC